MAEQHPWFRAPSVLASIHSLRKQGLLVEDESNGQPQPDELNTSCSEASVLPAPSVVVSLATDSARAAATQHPATTAATRVNLAMTVCVCFFEFRLRRLWTALFRSSVLFFRAPICVQFDYLTIHDLLHFLHIQPINVQYNHLNP